MPQRERVLIVDDSPSNIRVLNEILKADYNVMVATDGQKALAVLKLHLPDIILLDIVMPGIDGYQVCRQLKINPATSKIPIIFVTFKGDIEDEEQGFLVGAVDYITRPFSPPIVKARIRTHLMMKRQRDALMESEARYRTIYNNTPVMLHSIDTTGRVVSVSDYWLEVLGYTRGEVVGRELADFFTEQSSIYAQTVAIPQLLTKGFANSIPYQFIKKDGQIIDTLVSAIMEKDKSGNNVRSLCVVIDVTEFKRGQEELQRAKQSAEAANRSKSSFLATMSHEIRTPMNGVIGLTDLLLMTDMTDTQRSYTEKLRYSAYSLLDIINDILDISKIESGKLKLENIAFNFPEMVQQTISMVANRAAEKGISLHTEIASDIPSIAIGDPVRIRQIILNLLSNAVKFTNSGEVSVSVRREDACENGDGNQTAQAVGHQDKNITLASCHKQVEEEERKLSEQRTVSLVIAVKDTGIGIPESELDTIFESFTQADSSITREYGGTGLGLSISKHLAEMMYGRITLKSIHGEGSCFEVHLMLPIGEAETLYGEMGALFSVKDEKKDALHNLYSGTVMVAEDNPINMLVIRTYLIKMGFNVIEVANGKEAVTQYIEHGADLIFMDIHMPEMNGLEATQKIREYEGCKKHTPIIALTADAFKDDKDRCISEGMDFYLSKPFKPENIIKVIQMFGAGRSDQESMEFGGNSERYGDLPVFDRGAFLKRIENNMDIYHYVIAAFIQTSPSLLSKLHTEIDRGSLKEIVFQAHTLKGSSLTVGACRLSEIAKEIELKAFNHGNIKEIRDLYPPLEAALTEFFMEVDNQKP